MILRYGEHGNEKRKKKKKKSEPQIGYEPTTFRDLVGCSNQLSYWKLLVSKGQFSWSTLKPHRAATQLSNDYRK